MLQCSQPSQMPAGQCPRWISAATRLVGPHARTEARRMASRVPRGSRPFPVDATQWPQELRCATMKIDTLSVDFSDEQKRYLEGFTTGLQISRVGRGLGGGACGQRQCRADRTGRRAHQGAGQGHGGGQEACRPGKIQTRRTSVRRLSATEAAGADNAPPIAGRQFPLALLRPVLCRAGAGFLHVPAADSERHPETLAIRRHGRSCRAPVRTVQPRHHAGQSAGPRNSAEERGRP